MAIKILEDKSYEGSTLAWDKIIHSLEPDIDILPADDWRYFSSKVKLLIGKEIRLSNIPSNAIYLYMQRNDWIVNLMKYPMVVTAEYIRSEMTKFLSRLGLRISENGLGWKYGPMGFQEQKMIQEVTAIPEKPPR